MNILYNSNIVGYSGYNTFETIIDNNNNNEQIDDKLVEG